jgi:DNA-binding beta-propeller fold protein YncE
MLSNRANRRISSGGATVGTLAFLFLFATAAGCGEDVTQQVSSGLTTGHCELWVSDFVADGVQRFDASSGAYVGIIDPGGVNEAEGLIELSDRLYVSSYYNSRLARYDLPTIRFHGSKNTTRVVGPTGMTVGPDGSIYLSGYDSNNVGRFDPVTEKTTVFVAPGSGGLVTPHGLTFGPDGNLYVAAVDADTILKFSGKTGQPMGVFAKHPSMGAPFGLTFGPDGHLYVAAADTQRVVRFDGTTGAYIDTFVPAGAGGLQFPHSLAFGTDGMLYVTDYFAGTVLRFNGTSGALVDAFVPAGGQLQAPTYLSWHCN